MPVVVVVVRACYLYVPVNGSACVYADGHALVEVKKTGEWGVFKCRSHMATTTTTCGPLTRPQ